MSGNENGTACTTPLNLMGLAGAAYRAQATFDQAGWNLFGDHQLAELCKLRVSQLNGCAFCLDLHTRVGRRLGVSERLMTLVAAWQEAPVFDARQRAALALAEASAKLAGSTGYGELANAARQHFSDTELAGLLCGLAAINSWNRMVLGSGQAFPVDEDAAEALVDSIVGARPHAAA